VKARLDRLHEERQVKPDGRRIQLRIKPPKAPRITLRLTRPKRVARATGGRKRARHYSIFGLWLSFLGRAIYSDGEKRGAIGRDRNVPAWPSEQAPEFWLSEEDYICGCRQRSALTSTNNSRLMYFRLQSSSEQVKVRGDQRH
jgi:hypothetical protein